MSGDLREEVRALRRGDLRKFVALVTVLVLLAAVLSAMGSRAWIAPSVLAALLAAMYVSVARTSRERDERVLAMDDDAVRDYLRGRLTGAVRRAKREAIPAFVGVPLALFGLVIVVAVLAAGRGRSRVGELLEFGIAFTSIGGVFVFSLARGFVLRRKWRRRLAELGPAPPTTPAWVVEMAREIAAKRSVSYAALFWHEATGVGVREAGRAVRDLPDPPSAPPAPGPSDDVVRERVRRMARKDLAAHAFLVVLLLGVVAADVRAGGRTGEEFLRDGPSGFAQGAWLGFAALFFLGGLAVHVLHKKALAGGASALRAHCVREIDKRIARLETRKWTATLLAVAAVLFLAAAAGAAVTQIARHESVAAAPWLVEATLVFVWLVVLPEWNRRRALPRLLLLREEFRGPTTA